MKKILIIISILIAVSTVVYGATTYKFTNGGENWTHTGPDAADGQAYGYVVVDHIGPNGTIYISSYAIGCRDGGLCYTRGDDGITTYSLQNSENPPYDVQASGSE